ncbi:MAG TPA: peptidoglycan-binding protein [Solirubrobacteraceae bacterium]|nr:peptidoglycan-binding protein [Solirubrobacteraceae bacterium]
MLSGAESPETDVHEADADGSARRLPPPAEGPRRRRRRRIAALIAVALVALSSAAIVLSSSGSAPQRGGDTGIPPGDTTATVTRRTLTESATVDGTLGYGSNLDLYDRVAGTFTWLPAVGTVVRRGGTLWRIDDEPVVLMYGWVPAYRTLKEGVGEGPDVAELNRNLIALGYDPYGAIASVGDFGAATAAAVDRWQKAEGLPQTGKVELGRIVFAPGARRVTEAHVAIGQDPPGSEGPKTPGEEEASKSPQSPKAAGEEEASKSPQSPKAAGEEQASKSPQGSEKPAGKEPAGKEPAGKEPASKEPAAKEPTGENPAGEESASKEPTGENPASKESAGKEEPRAGAGELALTTTSTQQVVKLQLKAEQQQLARGGERVAVALPGGGVAHGRITKVGTVAAEPKGSGEEKGGGGEGESATVEVIVTLDRTVAHLDEAPVSVELVKSVSRHALTVPATALIAIAGGGYAVEALEAGRRVTVPVTPGMFAGGYVAVEASGLREGMAVIESQ